MPLYQGEKAREYIKAIQVLLCENNRSPISIPKHPSYFYRQLA